MIMQHAINNWCILHDNFSDPLAETLSQIGVSCSYVLYVIIAKYVPFQRHFCENTIFYSKLNSGATNSCYHRKRHVSACRSGKKVIARTNNYSKSNSGKGSLFSPLLPYYSIITFPRAINRPCVLTDHKGSYSLHYTRLMIPLQPLSPNWGTNIERSETRIATFLRERKRAL